MRPTIPGFTVFFQALSQPDAEVLCIMLGMHPEAAKRYASQSLRIALTPLEYVDLALGYGNSDFATQNLLTVMPLLIRPRYSATCPSNRSCRKIRTRLSVQPDVEKAMYLSDHCYALLQKIQQELALKPRSIRSASSPSIRELKNWCDRHELPTSHWLTPGQALFTPQVLDEIDELLAVLNQPLIGQVHSGQSRLAQAQNSSRENKSHGQPRQGRLLLLFENTGCNPAPLREAPADLVLDVAKTQLATDRYHSLLVIENLDCFYQCLQLHRQQRYQLPQACLDALIVFRGDGHDSKSVLQLVRDFRRQNRQTIYFGDFDAPGLCIALQNGYSHILLPEPDFLLKHACAEHNDPDQQKQFEWLQANTCNLPAAAPLRPCLDILLRDFRALKQQWFSGRLRSIQLTN